MRSCSCRPTEPGILSAHLHADGRYKDILCVPGQVNQGAVTGTPFVHMDGHAVFKFAVKVLAEVAHEALTANRKTVADIDWLIPHQANIRIMDATARKLELPLDKVISTVDRARQHVGGIDSACARRRGARRPHPRGPAPDAGRRRRRIHVGLGFLRW